MTRTLRRPRAAIILLRRLRADDRAAALMEFALCFPILFTVGGYGVEVSNLALTHLRVSQYALFLADNASRVGLSSGLASTTMREADVNEVFTGLRAQSATLKLTTYGRVILSSLEGQPDGSQLLHWQRCVGKKSGTGYDSSYGSAGSGTSGTTVSGMGDTGAVVTAPARSGVMFVEVNYLYQPLFGSTFMTAPRIHYIASFIVRDPRDFSKVVTNPTPTQTASTCTAYTI